MDSGDTEDDAILKCCKQHWVYKKNKNIKAHNNKVTKSNKAEEKRDPVTVLIAPDNLNQPSELFPEAVSFLMFREHPMFIRESYCTINRSSNTNAATPPSNDTSVANGDNTSPPDTEDAEVTTLRNRMTQKGYFKSRNTLRAEEVDRKKKQKVSRSDNDERELTVVQNDCHRTAAATKHAEAATLQAVTGIFQSQLAAIQKAQDMGFSAKKLRPFMLSTLTNLYSCGGAVLKNLGHNNIDSDDDPQNTFVGIRKSLEGEMLIDDDDDDSDDDDEDDDGSAEFGCAAGDCCIESSLKEISDDDPRCQVCNRRAHSLCITVDDCKSACLKFFGDDDD